MTLYIACSDGAYSLDQESQAQHPLRKKTSARQGHCRTLQRRRQCGCRTGEKENRTNAAQQTMRRSTMAQKHNPRQQQQSQPRRHHVEPENAGQPLVKNSQRLRQLRHTNSRSERCDRDKRCEGGSDKCCKCFDGDRHHQLVGLGRQPALPTRASKARNGNVRRKRLGSMASPMISICPSFVRLTLTFKGRSRLGTANSPSNV